MLEKGNSPATFDLEKARKILVDVAAILDSKNIIYHLEGGTLLGIIRDQDLLPWDDDMDISIPEKFLDNILAMKFALLRKGFRLTIRKNKVTNMPFDTGDIYVLRVKPLIGYLINWFAPRYKNIVLDIFVKKTEANFTYWQAKGKLMRVDNRYYSSFETVDFQGARLKVPNHYREYLTEKYGDWTKPIREWDCSKNELTIVNR